MNWNKVVFLDLETYAPISLPKEGVVKYCTHPNFAIIIGCFIYKNGKETIEDHSEIIDYVKYLVECGYKFVAHNASFEYYALQQIVPADKWICTSVMSSYFSGVSSLNNAAEYHGLKVAKLLDGVKLAVDWVSKHKGDIEVLKQNKLNWKAYNLYCERDAELCKALYFKIKEDYGDVPESEWKYFRDTLTLMRRRLHIDNELVKKSIIIRDLYNKKFNYDFEKKYGFNHRSYVQTLKWLEQEKVSLKSTSKKNVIAEYDNLPERVRKMFDFKFKASPSILKKFDMLDTSYIFPPIKHFGSISGRYTSDKINILNLPKSKEVLDLNLSPVDFINKYKKRTPELLKSMMRACIIAPKDHYIFATDFSLIEFRILMHVTGHLKDVLGKDVYLEFASKLFGGKYSKDSIERKVAKVCVLGMDYGMSPKTLWSNIKEIDSKIPYETALKGYKTFHQMFPNVKKLYKDMDIKIKRGDKYIELLNGRKLYFPHKKEMQGKLFPITNYGSGFVGTYIQANARELMFLKQHEFIKKGFYNIFNVYDEIFGYIKEPDKDYILDIMTEKIDWLPKEALSATVFIGKRYTEAV